MKENNFEVIRPGINTTYQDFGRKNLYHIGVPFSGAMDNRNYLISNKLVNNKMNSAVIEFAYQGPMLKFNGESTTFAITGDVNFNIKRKKNSILENFFSKDYFCYMTGFIAGMPFLGDINQEIRLNRLETPRVKVPKGSIGITEQFCNIYTFESPGGWNIIGNTPIKVFDKLNQ